MREAVMTRAADRCEYCGLAQAGQEATFHIDHVVPRSDSGPTELENLALACVSCSLRKAARQFIIDESGQSVALFNPRRQVWGEHFSWDGATLQALTPTGLVTVEALAMNRPLVVEIRIEETLRGRHPPPA
jgi:hypothetical protein